MTTNQVLEWSPFRLKQGTDEATLLQVSERLQRDFLANQDGFVRRELIKGAEGAYTDLVWWDSFAASQAAMRKAACSPAVKAYLAVMDFSAGDPRDAVSLFGLVGAYRPAPRLFALAI
jgi:hypothetical protein